MKRILLILLVVRLALFLLSATNGLMSYGGDAGSWKESDGGYRYRVIENRFLDPLNRWDGNAYLTIAFVGYDRGQDIRSNTAFFPGYSWVVRGVHEVLLKPLMSAERWGRALPSFFSAVIASLLLSIGCLALFRVWALSHFDKETVDRSLLLLLLLPSGCVLHFVMSEGTFLLCLLATFIAADRRIFWLAAIAAAGCTVTRSIGLIVVVPLFFSYIEDRREGEGMSWLWLIIPPLSLLGLLFHMAEVNGSFFAYFKQQNNFFYHDTFPSFSGIMQLFRLEGKDAVHLTRDALQILMTLWALFGCGLLWRHFAGSRHRISYLLLCLVLIGLPLLSGALGAMHRYVTVIFPLIAVWASIAWRPVVWRSVFGGLALIQAVLFVLWVHNHPILT